MKQNYKCTGIFFDNWNIRDLSPSWIRRQIGVVSQEPNLLNLTIRENIAYGVNFREKEPLMEEIINAARQANAHEFIMDLPEVGLRFILPFELRER